MSQNNSMWHFLKIIYFPILSAFTPFRFSYISCFTLLQARKSSSFCTLLPELFKATGLLACFFPQKYTKYITQMVTHWWRRAFSLTLPGNSLFRLLCKWTFLRLTSSVIWNITVNTNDTWIKHSDCKHYRRQVMFES